MKKYLPYIVIFSIGAFAGNMINIGLSYGLHWSSLEPVAFMESFKIDFPLLLYPTVVTLLPAFLGTIYLYVISSKNTLIKKYWLYALVGLLIVNVQTAVYHLPLNLKFMSQSIDTALVSGALHTWLIFHWFRVLVTLGSGVYALKAFSLTIQDARSQSK